MRVSQAVRTHLGEARCIFAPRASPLALVAVRRRPSVFLRRSFSGAPRLTAVRLADWRVQICSHVRRATGVFRRLPCLPSCSVGCGCGRSGTGDKWRGSARLGGRLGGSTRRLGLASATWLVGGSSSSRPPSSLLRRRRLSLVWLRHPRARARDAARRHARGGYDRGRDRDRRTGGDRREQRRPAAWRRREMQRSYERRRWLRDGRGGGTG